ncbi:hypothetical protein [Zobellella endophytica]|uniref:hypothetical protein n=1 Tax=Zobellella endophytica TaxID=2116700 RepID=UPI0013048AE6|nr:hypothetical protein [Zobellella endophytica]
MGWTSASSGLGKSAFDLPYLQFGGQPLAASMSALACRCATAAWPRYRSGMGVSGLT